VAVAEGVEEGGGRPYGHPLIPVGRRGRRPRATRQTRRGMRPGAGATCAGDGLEDCTRRDGRPKVVFQLASSSSTILRPSVLFASVRFLSAAPGWVAWCTALSWWRLTLV
jgi:hypothetical protein